MQMGDLMVLIRASIWLLALWGYVLKLNPTIDDVYQQPVKETKAIKVALEAQFDYFALPSGLQVCQRPSWCNDER